MRGCIVKRGPTSWAVVVYLGRDPQTGKDRRKWYSHPTRREAETHLTQLLAHVQAGGIVPSTRLRLGDYLEQWLRDYAAGAVAATTLASYQEIIRVHLVPAMGHLPLSRLSPQAIQGYYSRKLADGLSTSTVRRHAAVLHVALRHAARWGVIVRNPCDMTDPPRPRRPEMRVLDEEQIRVFLGEAKRSSPHYRLYLAALTTGMRQGELLGLRWQDVDPVLGVLSVRQTFYRLGKEQLFKEPKSATARRSVAIPTVLCEELRSLRAEQDKRRRMLGDEYEDRGLVFCQVNGRPLHAHNITQGDLQRVLKLETLRKGLLEQGVRDNALPKPLPRIRFHDLRHSHATLLAQQGVHPKIVQERLGHSTPAFTLQVYSHVLPGMQDQAVRALESRVFGGR